MDRPRQGAAAGAQRERVVLGERALALQAGRTQVDPTVRAAAYKKISQRFGADVPYIWIGPAVWIVAGRKVIGGLGQATLPDGGRARNMAFGVIDVAALWRNA